MNRQGTCGLVRYLRTTEGRTLPKVVSRSDQLHQTAISIIEASKELRSDSEYCSFLLAKTKRPS